MSNMVGSEARVISFEFDKIRRYQKIPHVSDLEVESMVRGIKLREDNLSQIKSILIESKALLKGHFRLRSGGHSSFFLQFARIAQRHEHINFIAKLIIDRFSNLKIDTVLSPNTAGTLLGVRIAYLLQSRFIQCFLDKGKAELRPGFSIDKNERILAVNDIATTGSGIRALEHLGREGELVGLASFACRYPANYESFSASLSVKYESLTEFCLDYFDVENGEACPLCPEPPILADELY